MDAVVFIATVAVVGTVLYLEVPRFKTLIDKVVAKVKGKISG